MTRTEKEALISDLKQKIEDSRAIFLTNLIGVSSNDAVAIRKEVRENNGAVIVTRNTLFERAAAGTKAEELLKGLKGPHAVAFAFEDAPPVAKALKKAGEAHELVDLKGGLLGDEILTVEKVKALADLPSRDEMLGTLLATFNAPISALARVLFAIQEQKDGGVTTEEAPAEA